MGKKNKYKKDDKEAAAPAPQQRQQQQTAAPAPSTSAAARENTSRLQAGDDGVPATQRPQQHPESQNPQGEWRRPQGGQQRGPQQQQQQYRPQQQGGQQRQLGWKQGEQPRNQQEESSGQQGGYQQRGPSSGPQGGAQGGGQQGGYQQRGPSSGPQGGAQGGGQQGGYQQRGLSSGPQGGTQDGGQQGGYQQRGPSSGPQGGAQGGGQQGGYQQRGPSSGPQGGAQGGGQQGGYQQRGPSSGPQGGAQGGGQQGGGQQGGYQQRGPSSGPQGGAQGGGQQGGYQQRGPPGQQQGGYQQRGPQGPQQGGYQQRGPPPAQQGGYQQRGPPQGQQGGYQQRGPPQGQRTQGGALAPLLPQTGNIKRGTIGNAGRVGVNYLDVDISKMPDIAYHYDVTIVPERPKKFYRKAFEVFRAKHLDNGIAAFDGRKSCYSVDKLPNVTGQVEVIDPHGRTVRYTLTIKDTDNSLVELSSLRSYMNDKIYDKPMRALQCLEVVFAVPCHTRSIRAGRSYFKTSDNGERRDLGDGYEALVGLYQSFVLGDRPFVNVDVSHKSFPIAMSMIEYLERYGLQSAITPATTLNNTLRLIPFIKGINVVYEPPKCFGSAPRVYKVNGLSEKPANEQKFELEGEVKTVDQYFRSRNYTLRFPKLQCLHVGPPSKYIYLPMELCRIEEGQALNRKDGTNQVSEMIKFAATSTNERKAKILDLLRYFKHNSDPVISRFGIHVAGDFITVSTRQLPAPQLEYHKKNFARPFNGSWRMDNLQFLVVKPKTHRWAILHFEGARMHYNKVAELQDLVIQQARYVNVCLEPKADIRTFGDARNLDVHFKDLKDQQYDLVFVILASRGPSYDIIKQKAELQYGILTQCIKQNNVERRLNGQLVGNILLKVNSKLNGVNHKLKDDPRTMLANVMYLGADVTHPSPDQRDIPSVVGVAASHDMHGGSYNMQYRLQCGGGGGAREEIEDMESIVTEHLRVYQQYQKRYPDHIIYYRDGVSDGQFLKIQNIELKGIYVACTKLGIKPKMCCIIVVKRHHTRFFPEGMPSNPRNNKFNNVEPGTVVDRTIVHPNEMQFFMVSHQSIQGTAKPTRYNVIENTGKLDIDLLQQLTYNLCHMFPRCNRSVSYPAPAYLAHLAAARGRVYITGARLSRSPKEEYQRRLIVPAFLRSNPMYFV
nr:protein argonaute-2 isoform X3 [Drosophila virilis]